MTTQTNFLGKIKTTNDLEGSDLFRLWSQRFGGDVGLSLTILTEYMKSQIQTATLTAQYAAPSATGFTVVITDPNKWLILTPEAIYANGTIQLPVATQDDEVVVNTTQGITVLNVTAPGTTTVIGAPVSAVANDFFRLKYDSVLDRWYRIG